MPIIRRPSAELRRRQKNCVQRTDVRSSGRALRIGSRSEAAEEEIQNRVSGGLGDKKSGVRPLWKQA